MLQVLSCWTSQRLLHAHAVYELSSRWLKSFRQVAARRSVAFDDKQFERRSPSVFDI